METESRTVLRSFPHHGRFTTDYGRSGPVSVEREEEVLWVTLCVGPRVRDMGLVVLGLGSGPRLVDARKCFLYTGETRNQRSRLCTLVQTTFRVHSSILSFTNLVADRVSFQISYK